MLLLPLIRRLSQGRPSDAFLGFAGLGVSQNLGRFRGNRFARLLIFCHATSSAVVCTRRKSSRTVFDSPASPSLPAFGRGLFGRPNLGRIVPQLGRISPSMEVFLVLVACAALYLWVRVPV